jgi:hypothetical protein
MTHAKLADYVRDLEAEIRESLAWYTRCHEINALLHQRIPLTDQQQVLLQHLDGAIRDAPPLDEDLALYRAIRGVFRIEDVADHYGGFVSTSLSPLSAAEFGDYCSAPCILLKITLSKGRSGLLLQPLSAFPNQQEVLLSRATRLCWTGLVERIHDLPFHCMELG